MKKTLNFNDLCNHLEDDIFIAFYPLMCSNMLISQKLKGTKYYKYFLKKKFKKYNFFNLFYDKRFRKDTWEISQKNPFLQALI